MSILSNNFYYQPLKIDSINTKVYGDFVAKEGDANGRGLLVTLTENGLQKDTTGITLNLKWAHTTVLGLQNLDPFEAVDLTKGLYKITYPTDMLRKGKVDAFIQIIDSGKLIGSRNIKINVEATVGDDTAIESSNEFRALASALVEVQSWNSRIDDVEQEFIDRANNLDATYPIELNSLKTQLEQAETYLYDYALEDGEIKPPADFTTLPFQIFKKGDEYSHNYVVDDTGYTSVYISSAGGSYSGLVEGQPITLVRFVENYNASVYTAYTKIKLVMLQDVYAGATATFSNLDLDLIIQPKNTRTWIGKMHKESDTSYFTGVWGAYNAIQVITLAYNMGIIDFINTGSLDANGMPKPYVQATSIANCEATKGSWYKDGTNLKLYCNPHAGHVASNSYLVQNAAVLNLNVKSGRSAIVKNINFVTSSYSFTGQSITSLYYFVGSKFYGGLQDAMHLGGDYKSFSLDCVAAYGSKDCFNYYRNVDTGTTAFEINCIGYGAGQFKLSGGNTSTNSNNGSTAHNGIKVMRVGCRYYKCEGPIVADADNCYSINIGCYVGSILTTATGVLAGFYLYNSGVGTNKQYVVNCVNNNKVGYDVQGDIELTTTVMYMRGRNKVRDVVAADVSSLFVA